MKDLVVLFQFLGICLYLFIESIIIGAVLLLAWNTTLVQFFHTDLTFFNCVILVWAFKLIRFDLFKYIQNTNNNDPNKQENG